MIDEELLLQKAKELKVDVPDNDLNSAVDRQIREIKARFPTEAQRPAPPAARAPRP